MTSGCERLPQNDGIGLSYLEDRHGKWLHCVRVSAVLSHVTAAAMKNITSISIMAVFHFDVKLAPF
jgi:hypothetical protein